MASKVPPSHAVTCAENIALLYLLHSVPALPSRNPVVDVPVHQKNYTLSLLRERSLAGTLAFLSNLKDGPDHIPAVCVQEDSDSAFLKVLLAVNRTRPSDGKEALRDIGQGFERIFAELSQISDGIENAAVEDRVFSVIISMCSARILCRLRLISNTRKQPKQPIKELLQDAINSIQQLKNKISQDSKLLQTSKLFAEKAKEVIKLIDAWVKHRTLIRLGELVEGFHCLWRIGELQVLLNTIPNRDIGPSSRKNLLNTISKVARYREAARSLYRTAKKTPLVRNMKTVLVSLPQNIFQKTSTNSYTPSLSSTISQIGALNGEKWSLDHVCRLLNVSEIEAHNQFAQQARKTLKEAKIHAEIQLLLYCELEASKLPPRVVCSTKDACFLCNAFITVHGKMHTPRCHGRLYPGWRLPFSPRLKETEQRFNHELANHIKNSLRTLLARRQKTIYPDPNESTLLTLLESLSTVDSPERPEIVIKEEKQILQPEIPNHLEIEENPPISSNVKSSAEDMKSTLSPSPTVHIGDEPPNGIASQTTLSNPPSPEEPSDSACLETYTLIQKQTLSKSVKAGHTSPLYTTGPLEIQIEYTIEPGLAIPSNRPSNLSYSIEWLTVDEAERVLKQNPASVYSAESLEGQISLDIDDLNCCYITARGLTLKVFLEPSSANLD